MVAAMDRRACLLERRRAIDDSAGAELDQGQEPNAKLRVPIRSCEIDFR